MIRPNIVPIVQRIANTPGIDTVAMTTNAVLLGTLAKPLAEAGLQRVNISIDTLNPEKFKKITRWGSIDDIHAGIQASIEAGLGIKFNCVVVRHFNDKEDVVDLARLTQKYPYQMRYIEMMPFGDVADFQQAGIVSEEELKQTISAQLGPLSVVNEGILDGEAKLYRLDNAPGILGFISSVTAPFCASCNRARLTADGRLRLCLLRDKEVDLLTPLRAGATDDDLEQLITDGIYHKPWGHGLDNNVIPITRIMSEIGG